MSSGATIAEVHPASSINTHIGNLEPMPVQHPMKNLNAGHWRLEVQSLQKDPDHAALADLHAGPFGKCVREHKKCTQDYAHVRGLQGRPCPLENVYLAVKCVLGMQAGVFTMPGFCFLPLYTARFLIFCWKAFPLCTKAKKDKPLYFSYTYESFSPTHESQKRQTAICVIHICIYTYIYIYT